MNTFVVAVFSIALSVAAQFALKAGMSGASVRELLAEPLTVRAAWSILTDRFVLGGFLLYGVGAIVWLSVLAKWDVSKAYPLVGMGFVFTVLIGLVIGEAISPIRLFGVLLISAGVLLMGQS